MEQGVFDEAIKVERRLRIVNHSCSQGDQIFTTKVHVFLRQRMYAATGKFQSVRGTASFIFGYGVHFQDVSVTMSVHTRNHNSRRRKVSRHIITIN